jgi:hypothetical protein
MNAAIPKKQSNFLRPILATALLTVAFFSEGSRVEITVKSQK